MIAKLGDMELTHRVADMLMESVGTPNYGNWKQGLNKCEGAQLVFRSDIFALGVTCYELLYDRRPLE